MTKKHFIALAAEIKSEFQLDCPWDTLSPTMQTAALAAVKIVCRVAASENPRFNETVFRAACGVPAL